MSDRTMPMDRRRPPPPRAFSWPWLDRSGRVSRLKLAVFLAVLVPGAWLAVQWATASLGPRPVTEVIHGTGLWAIRFLLITLALTPLARAAQWQRAAVLRRMLGLTALGYALAHLSLYVVDMKFDLAKVATEIALRIYLTIGFAALLGLVALGWTSTDGWMRSLGRRWKRLHRLIYVIAPLAILHFFMQSKADVSQAVLIAGFFAWLMAWRQVPPRWQASPLALLLLAPVSAAAAALFEFAWYGLATRIPATRVFLANFDLAFGPRPAVVVGLVAIGVALLLWVRQAAPKLIPPRARRA